MSEMIECGSAIRGMGAGAGSMEEAAGRIVRYLHENFGDRRTGAQSCALVRLYRTCPYGELDGELKYFARRLGGGAEISPETKCLTLLATAGDRSEWNSRESSEGHKAVPLPSAKVVSQAPMISQLIVQFGLDIGDVVRPDPAVLLELEQKTFNVFHVEEAAGSPYVPAQQDFVVKFGIRSVLGFGGMLPDGNLFAIIMFSRTVVPREKTDMFKTLSLSAKIALLPFAGGTVFA
ncbi:MAG: hypothetical protein HY896_13665 [Deltaproteobacteria bacterium]|nr:hypothetical protein [Deltaproteobacteria bacterium]